MHGIVAARRPYIEECRIDQESSDNLAAKLRPYATGGSFLNFLSDPTQTATAFTAEDYRRLETLKRIYDPDNVFRHNHNIPPFPALGNGRATESPREDQR